MQGNMGRLMALKRVVVDMHGNMGRLMVLKQSSCGHAWEHG